MQAQHALVVEQKDDLVAHVVLADDAFILAVDDALACHVRHVGAQLALERLAIFDHQLVVGRDALRVWGRASALAPVDALMIGLMIGLGGAAGQQHQGQQVLALHGHGSW